MASTRRTLLGRRDRPAGIRLFDHVVLRPAAVAGIAEAGAYPGLIYFITLWFPPTYRVGVVGVLTLGSAFGNMLGALVGGPLLDLNGVLGFAGWQWVFLATGVPAVIMTFAILLFLPSTPSAARFLSAEEKLG